METQNIKLESVQLSEEEYRRLETLQAEYQKVKNSKLIIRTVRTDIYGYERIYTDYMDENQVAAEYKRLEDAAVIAQGEATKARAERELAVQKLKDATYKWSTTEHLLAAACFLSFIANILMVYRITRG